jgi:hypothetical protein
VPGWGGGNRHSSLLHKAVSDRFAGFGQTADIPVVGDWNGDGKTEIGSFKDGFWAVDYNSNYIWNGAVSDRFAGFGLTGDTPIVGKLSWKTNFFLNFSNSSNYMTPTIVIQYLISKILLLFSHRIRQWSRSDLALTISPIPDVVSRVNGRCLYSASGINASVLS